MSFIRMSQESEYVDLGDGSREYIYDDGHSVAGHGFTLDYGPWIFALCKHARLAGFPEETVDELERDLENHYGVHSEETQQIGPKPEMAHIVAQHIDSRLDSLELHEDMVEQLQSHAEEAFANCPQCDARWRPTPYITDEQGDLCRDCWNEKLMARDVSCDTDELRRYVEEELPDDIPPTETQDDEFYALTMYQFTDREGTERNALAHQLGEAADEIMDAHEEERPVDKDKILRILDRVSA